MNKRSVVIDFLFVFFLTLIILISSFSTSYALSNNEARNRLRTYADNVSFSISNDVDFILFDVKYNNWWLERKNCEDIANKCGIKIVPIVGYMTIPEAIDLVKKGFKSSISEDKNLIAEGLVLKTPQGLLSRDGKRIITKIKHNDFVKFKNVYGQDF